MVSMMEEFRPVSWRSGWRAAFWLPLVVEERMDWLSVRVWSRPVVARESGRRARGDGCSAWGVKGEKVEAATCPNGLLDGD